MILQTDQSKNTLLSLVNYSDSKVLPDNIRSDIESCEKYLIAHISLIDIEEISKLLAPKIFDIKLDILEWLRTSDRYDKITTEALEKYLGYLILQFQHSRLHRELYNIIQFHTQIIGESVLANTPVKNELFEYFNKEDHKYEILRNFHEDASPGVKAMADFLDSTLDIEVAIIIANLIFENRIMMSEESITDSVVPFLRTSLIKFGGYAIFTGFWNPQDVHKDGIIEQMALFNSKLELDNGMGQSFSSEDLAKLMSI